MEPLSFWCTFSEPLTESKLRFTLCATTPQTTFLITQLKQPYPPPTAVVLFPQCLSHSNSLVCRLFGLHLLNSNCENRTCPSLHCRILGCTGLPRASRHASRSVGGTQMKPKEHSNKSTVPESEDLDPSVSWATSQKHSLSSYSLPLSAGELNLHLPSSRVPVRPSKDPLQDSKPPRSIRTAVCQL